jgi:hypothetical protein
MPETGLPFLAHWQNFYMITGTAAATLTGLMFIVITLIADIERRVPTLNAGISAFNTPTVVHFCTVLLMAAILSAPWQAFWSVGLVLGLLGLGEVFYLLTVIRRMRRVPGYQTPLKDWLWYIAVPLSAHIVLIVSAVTLPANPALVLYLISVVMVVLLFTGIRNAWDLVTFLAVERSHPEHKNSE